MRKSASQPLNFKGENRLHPFKAHQSEFARQTRGVSAGTDSSNDAMTRNHQQNRIAPECQANRTRTAAPHPTGKFAVSNRATVTDAAKLAPNTALKLRSPET